MTGTFKVDRWANRLHGHGIPWPRLESGALDLKDDTFRDMARAFPAIGPSRNCERLSGKCGCPIWPWGKTGAIEP